MVLLVLGLELLEEVDQRLSALNGHGVVNARAQTADGLVALEVIVARSLGGGDDFGIQLGGVGDEGDYPYNISSQIFFHILQWRNLVVCCSGMLQKEVAERLAAPPGTKARGILSVLLQAWYDVEYLFTVDEHVFNPPPKVKSGVVKLTRNNVDTLGCDEALFRTVVKTTFGQRRKTLRNSLKGLLPAGAPMPDSPLLALRPEQLSVSQFIELTNLVDAAKAAAKA